MTDPALDPAAAASTAGSPPTTVLDGDDHRGSRSPSSVTQSSTIASSHPSVYGGPVHYWTLSSSGAPQPQPTRTKRRQVKNACTNCQKACKKCDDARPCLRCVKYGIAEECVDSQRKERQKGIKRGPYKKRDGKDRASASVEQQLDLSVQSGYIPAAVAAATSATPPIPYMTAAPIPYPPFVGMPAAATKPGEGPAAYTYPPAPSYFLAPIPMQMPQQPGQEGEAPVYQPYYGVFQYAGPPYPAAPYMMAPSMQRDGQQVPQAMPMPMPIGQMPMAQMPVAGMAPLPAGMAPPHMQYAPAPYAQAYQKPPSSGSRDGNDMNAPPSQQMMEPARRDPRLDQYGGRMGEGLSGSHGGKSA